MAEFNRLCKESYWDKNDPEKKAARYQFNVAIKEEFDDLYGSDEKDINNWHKLCRVLRVDPVPDTLRECRAVSPHLFGTLTSQLDRGFRSHHRLSSRSTSILSTLSRETRKKFESLRLRENSANTHAERQSSFQRKTRWTGESCARFVVIFLYHETRPLKRIWTNLPVPVRRAQLNRY